MNPLLAPPAGSTRFDFSAIEPRHIAPAVDTLLDAAQAALRQVCEVAFPAKWTDLSAHLDVATERLGAAWSAISHLNSVMDTPELRAAYNLALPQVTAFYTELAASEALYAKYKAIDVDTLTAAQRQAHHNALRAFQLGGAHLQGADKARYAWIDERLSALAQTFSENVLDSTDAFTYVATEAQMAGIAQDVKRAAKARFDALPNKKDWSQPGYLLTLKAPCYLPVMQDALDRDLREILYKAYVTRASEQGSSAHDNSAVILEMLQLKTEQAKLLGYDNHAQVSLATKMARSASEVITFLRDLALRAKPYALKDAADLRDFAAAHLGLANPQAWDWMFISERLKESRYAYSESEVKNYFQLPKVLHGLFEQIEWLFDVQIQPAQAPVWSDTVGFYQIMRKGQLVAQFYLDTVARQGKRGGAWMDDAQGRWLRPDTQTQQVPIAHLVCNFAEGLDGKPALLTHDDVITLFHEFGHGLHHMLTQIDERDVAGINGVEWDAVELPSQFMENLCWEWEVLRSISAHIDSAEPLPRALFDKMLAAKNNQAGLQTMRQVEYALFDILLHSQTQPIPDPLELLKQVQQETAVLPIPDYARMAHSFSHIFAGGYAAGYYSYKWAEVLSSDCYAAFEEAPSVQARQDVAQRFLKEILQTGGSRPALDSFIAFRGRAPTIDALLRHLGLSASPTASAAADA